MKNLFLISVFSLLCLSLYGQDQTLVEKGTVTFVSRLSVYVKFPSTKNINIGDTLFIQKEEQFIPALVISNKSSTSTVCKPISEEKLQKSDELFIKIPILKEAKKKPKEPTHLESIEAEMQEDEHISPTATPEENEVVFKQKIRGRISAGSYSNLSDYQNSHRMRYAFSFKGNNLKNSKFSTYNQITFRHTLGEWHEVQENLAHALKVYSLAVKYEMDESNTLIFGRKINPKISSMGAIDGFQYERKLGKSLFLGTLAGLRPNFSDYSLDFNLPQLGGYLSYSPKKEGSHQHSTLGFIEQRNKAKTDRRLIYFQHTGQLAQNLNLFASFEADLYENINNEVKNSLRFTNFFVSLRYRASKKIRISASYDNRKNVIYYESYKYFIDRLIENETRQGLRLGFSYRPVRFVSWGVNSSLRFQKNKGNVSNNLNTYLSFTRIPILKLRATIRANFLETNYLTSQIFGGRVSKELIKRKLNAEVYLRKVNYQYKRDDRLVKQNILGASLSLRVMKKLSLYLYYEGVLEDGSQKFTRINTKLIQRL